MKRRETGKPEPQKLQGTIKSPYQEHMRTRSIERGQDAIAQDPLIREAVGLKERALEDAVAALDSGSAANRELVSLTGTITEPDPYGAISAEDEEEIGNGSTLPFRWRGRPTTAFTSCSEPEPDKNRGCPFYYRCPLRNLGPFYLPYLDQATGQTRADSCAAFISTGLALNPKIVLLPGVDYFYSSEVEWAPHKNGQPVESGPGKPKTHLVRTTVKNHLPAVPDRDIVRQYQILRMRGEVR